MEYFVIFTVLAAFGYFLYRKVRATREERENRPAPAPRPRQPYDPDRDIR